MELVNDFTVSVPVEEAWTTLTDVERIAPCLPGAQLQEIEGDTYRGVVKVKVGPITAQFKGEAHFVERDQENHRAVLKAAGRDTGGKGNASALITAELEPHGEGETHVTVTADLTITGKVAQFGRGTLADVSTKLIGQFVEQLETTVLNEPLPAAEAAAAEAPGGEPGLVGVSTAPDTPAGAASASAEEPAAPAAPAARRIEGPDAEPVDLIGVAGPPVLKRLVPVALLVLVVLLLLRRRRR